MQVSAHNSLFSYSLIPNKEKCVPDVLALSLCEIMLTCKLFDFFYYEETWRVVYLIDKSRPSANPKKEQ